MKTREDNIENIAMVNSDDGLGILLLVIAFNSTIFVGPALRFFYDAILWCNKRKEGSGSQDSNRKCLTNWCADGMDTDCVDSNHEEGNISNNSHNVDTKDTDFNNTTDNVSSPRKSKSRNWMKGSEMNDFEHIDDENYIMKSPSSSSASSNQLDESLSDSSLEKDAYQGTYNCHI